MKVPSLTELELRLLWQMTRFLHCDFIWTSLFLINSVFFLGQKHLEDCLWHEEHHHYSRKERPCDTFMKIILW